MLLYAAAPIQPLPNSHLIFRVSSQGAGKCWMDALELALKCSSLLIRSMSTRSTNVIASGDAHDAGQPSGGQQQSSTQTGELWCEADLEKHFKDHGNTLSLNLIVLQAHIQNNPGA